MTIQLPTFSVQVAFALGASTTTLLTLDDPTRGLLDTGTLGDDNSGTTPIWTDISAYVLSFTTVRGSSRISGPLIAYDTGTCTMELINDDGRFDPSNLSGPYVDVSGSTQVTPMRAVRILATWNGTVYEVWRGFADQWTPSWEGLGSTCALTASDAFKVFSGISRTAGAAVGAGEASGARVTRVLDGLGWPAADRVIAAGDTTLQATTLDGDPLSEMRLTSDSEIGELYMDGGGRVVFRNRNALLQDARSASSQGTYGNTSGLAYENVTTSTDDVTFYNQVKATKAGGGTEQLAEDSASEALYFTKTFRPTSDPILQNDSDVLSYCQWLLHVASAPENRFDTLLIRGWQDPNNLYPQVLGRELGDRITVTRVGAYGTRTEDVFIRGISQEYTLEGQELRTTWALQSAARYGSFLVLDDPTLGKLDSGNALAY